jgi:hypothetical protein
LYNSQFFYIHKYGNICMFTPFLLFRWLGSYLLESLESKLDVYERQLLDLNKYSDKLTDEYSHKVSNKHIGKIKIRIFLYIHISL